MRPTHQQSRPAALGPPAAREPSSRRGFAPLVLLGVLGALSPWACSLDSAGVESSSSAGGHAGAAATSTSAVGGHASGGHAGARSTGSAVTGATTGAGGSGGASTAATTGTASTSGTGGMPVTTATASTGTGGATTTSTTAATTTTTTGSGGAGGGCGTVNCKDPACLAEGYSCVDLPAGWSPVTYSEMVGATCPAGWDTPVTYLDARDPGGACSCACGAPLTDPCTTGAKLTLALGGSNNQCGSEMVTAPINGLACQPMPKPTKVDARAAATLTPGPTGCSAVATPPPLSMYTGTSCRPVTLAPGCSMTAACVMTGPPVCVWQAGNAPCPGGFSTTFRLVLDAADVMDERTCMGPCGCTSDATTCSPVSLTLASGPGCAGDKNTVTSDGTCDVLVNGGAGDSTSDDHVVLAAAPTPNASTCTASGALPMDMGVVALTTEYTICCP